MVGNDIVDLQFFESPPYRHIRYLDRVCLPPEAVAIRRSQSPVRMLAMIWASKEAAFKLISRKRGRRHFVPREFVTDFRASEDGDVFPHRFVWYGRTQLAVQLSVCDEWVHATATSSLKVDVGWLVKRISCAANPGSAVGSESAAAREVARTLLDESGFASTSWGGYTSARLAADSVSALRDGIAVSLSHHGAYAAAAVAWNSNALSEANGRGNRQGEQCSTCTA